MPGPCETAPVRARVTLLSTPGCHLCEDARAVVARVTAELGAGFDEVDVHDDAHLLARYGEQIPVVLLDGEQHAVWFVDEDRLRAALRS